MQFLDRLPWVPLILFAILLGLAPFFNAQGEFEPHLVQKLNMLMEGTLSKPLDIFDLLMHATPIVLVILKLFRMGKSTAQS